MYVKVSVLRSASIIMPSQCLCKSHNGKRPRKILGLFFSIHIACTLALHLEDL